MSLSSAPPVPFTFKNTKRIGSFQFLCSCWLCLCFFVRASASDCPYSFQFSFSYCVSFCCFIFIFVLAILLTLLLLIFFLLCFAGCCVFVLIPPLSHLFFLPPTARALEKENNGKNKIQQISHFVCLWVSLGKFPRFIFCFLLWISFVCFVFIHMFPWSTRLFALCLCILMFVVWVRTFFRSKLSLVSGFFGLVILSVCSLLISVLLRLWCFFCAVLSLFSSLRHLGSFFITILLSCSVFYCISWLLVYSSGFLFFWWEPSWGSCGHGHMDTEAANIFSAFSDNRDVWSKTGAAHQEGMQLFYLQLEASCLQMSFFAYN